jgi:hypothetical protein
MDGPLGIPVRLDIEALHPVSEQSSDPAEAGVTWTREAAQVF